LQIEKRLNTTIAGLSTGLWHAHDKKTDAPRLMEGFRSDDHVLGRKCIVNTRRLPTSIICHSTLLLVSYLIYCLSLSSLATFTTFTSLTGHGGHKGTHIIHNYITVLSMSGRQFGGVVSREASVLGTVSDGRK